MQQNEDLRAAAEWATEKRRRAGGLRSPESYQAKVLRDLRDDPERIRLLLADRDRIASQPRKVSLPLSLPEWEGSADGPQNDDETLNSWPEVREHLPIFEWLEKRRPDVLEKIHRYARLNGMHEVNDLGDEIRADLARAPGCVQMAHFGRDAMMLQSMVDEFRRRYIFGALRLTEPQAQRR